MAPEVIFLNLRLTDSICSQSNGQQFLLLLFLYDGTVIQSGRSLI
jgi:hypothetical protein